jgi:hypothetical protein
MGAFGSLWALAFQQGAKDGKTKISFLFSQGSREEVSVITTSSDANARHRKHFPGGRKVEFGESSKAVSVGRQ